MKKVFLVRHAESEENSGMEFEDSHIVRLSEEGKKQSLELAKKLKRPNRIFVSKFLRTQLTAEPFILRHKNTDVFLWLDLHEFQPHNKKNKNTQDKLNNKSFYLKYWEKFNPSHREAPDLENFEEVITRVLGLIKKMQKIKDGTNYFFTHGMLIKLLLFFKENKKYLRVKKKDYVKLMKDFHDFNLQIKPKNAEVFDISELVK